MNLKEMSLEQLKEIVGNAPEGAEYYRSSNQTYYKFLGCKAWFYSELYEGWTTYPDLYNELKASENLIKLSDIRTRIAELEPVFKVGDRVVRTEKSSDDTEVYEVKEIVDECYIAIDGYRQVFPFKNFRHATPEEDAAGHRIDSNSPEFDGIKTQLDNEAMLFNEPKPGCKCHEFPIDAELKPDPVNHPSHYTSDPSGIECIQITRHRNFNIGNAMKYLWRAGLKDQFATVQDLQKAVWYINDEIERLKGEQGE